MPKVSIIVPIYNTERYLDRCLQSLLNQTLKDIEIILVDDGSTDNSPKKCNDYANIDPRVKVIHKENGGAGYARNSGIKIANGEFLAFVDSDDFVDISMYEKLYSAATKGDYDAIFCGFNKERDNKIGWTKSNEITEDRIFEKKDIQELILDMIASRPEIREEREYSMSVWRSIYKKKIIEDLNILFASEKEVGSEDLLFQINFLNHSNRIYFLKEQLYYYTTNQESISSTFKKDKFKNYLNLYSILSEQVSIFQKADIRCARFFSGYIRWHLLQLVSSSVTNKIEIIKDICNNAIWTQISKLYPLSEVKDNYQYLFYLLILNKRYHLIYYYSKAVHLLKKFLKH